MKRLSIDKLGFSYGSTQIFNGFCAEFISGRTLLLGPNGAGKSTLMELVAGMRNLKKGEFLLDGAAVSNKKLRSKVGFMPQHITALRGITVLEQVAYSGWLAGMSRKDADAAAKDMVAAVGLSELASRKATKLSGGQLRRVGLASLLVCAPDILLLDEPLAGLDPGQRMRFRELLLSDICDDCIVVVSSHQLEDVERLFDRVVVISAGKNVFTGTTEEFLANSGVSGDNSTQATAAYVKLLGGMEL